MYSLKILVVAVFIISLATASAFANRQNSLPASEIDGGQNARLERLREAIGLSPQQQEDIRAIITENQLEMVDLRNEMRGNRDELRRLLKAEDLDESRLRLLVAKQSELRIRKITMQHAMRNRINGVLTEEQRQQWDAFRQQRRRHREAFNHAVPLIDETGR